MHHTHNASHPQESEWDSGSCHDVRHHTVQYKHVNRMYPCTSETNKIKDNNTWNLPKQTQSKKKNSPLEHYSNVRLNCVTGRSHIHWACPDYKYILIFIRIYMQSSDQIPRPRPRGYVAVVALWRLNVRWQRRVYTWQLEAEATLCANIRGVRLHVSSSSSLQWPSTVRWPQRWSDNDQLTS